MNLQSILAAVVVLGAIVFLVKMKSKKGSCGSGCGCSSTEKKEEHK